MEGDTCESGGVQVEWKEMKVMYIKNEKKNGNKNRR